MSSEAADRIAIEPAIWLKALLFGGSAEELLKMALTGRVRLVSSREQIDRLVSLLGERLEFSTAAQAQIRAFVEDMVEVVEVETGPAAGAPDELPSLLQAARAGSVSAIATIERSSLSSLESFEGIPIVSVA